MDIQTSRNEPLNVSIYALSVSLPEREKSIRTPCVVGPQVDQAAGKFRTVVGEQILGRPALSRQTVKRLDHILAAQTLATLDSKRFAAEHVDHRQRPELLPVAQLVVDEVQAPGFIEALGLASRLSVNDGILRRRGCFVRKTQPSSRYRR